MGTDKLPDRIKRIEVLRVEHGMAKTCNCQEPSYTVDYANRLVYCNKCRAIVEPFTALYNLARHYDRLESQVQNLLEQGRELANYKLHSRVIRELEKQHRSNKFSMMPICPVCSEPFELKDLKRWVNREFLR